MGRAFICRINRYMINPQSKMRRLHNIEAGDTIVADTVPPGKSNMRSSQRVEKHEHPAKYTLKALPECIRLRCAHA